MSVSKVHYKLEAFGIDLVPASFITALSGKLRSGKLTLY